MALTALSGNIAERLLTTSQEVRHAFEAHFAKNIRNISKIGGVKKGDVRIDFEDGCSRIQNKNGGGCTRGWSANRAPVDRYAAILPEESRRHFTTLLDNVCLLKGFQRPEVIQPKDFIAQLILGNDPENAPTHFTHTKLVDGNISELSILPASEFIEWLSAQAYQTFRPARTCVHLSPQIYLQRKGGDGPSESRPNEIQLKIKELPPMKCIFKSTIPQPA